MGAEPSHDEEVRELARRAGSHDLEAAKRLVDVLARAQEPENPRRVAALKAWETRRKNAARAERSDRAREAARRAWRTRRARGR